MGYTNIIWLDLIWLSIRLFNSLQLLTFLWYCMNNNDNHQCSKSTYINQNCHNIKITCLILFWSLMPQKQLWPVRRWTADLWGLVVPMVLSSHECSIRLGSGQFGDQVKALSSLSYSISHSWIISVVWQDTSPARGVFSNVYVSRYPQRQDSKFPKSTLHACLLLLFTSSECLLEHVHVYINKYVF